MPDRKQYVTLGIAAETLAIPVERVQEILELRPISRLPHAPASFLGMIDVRNDGVPVFDLRRQLGFEAGTDDDGTRIVVLNGVIAGRSMTVGLKTDRVFEVTALDRGDLESPPSIGTPWRSDSIAGIGRRDGAFVTVLDLERLFAASEIDFMVRPDASASKAA